MITLRHLDDRLLSGTTDLARHTGWLHGALLCCASYGVVAFALLRVPLTALTGWLRQQPGVRQAFPGAAARPTAPPESAPAGARA